MKINQAFTILRNAGGIRAARIITENTPNLGRLRVWRMARQLRRGMPVAKIIHKKWFYGLPFYTDRHTLDPRPDTETLVAAVIADCGVGASPDILDLGTGTGCIIAACVRNISGAHGVAVDRSRGALRVARKNIRDLGLAHAIDVRRGNFGNPKLTHGRRFDIIVSNPPYIAYGDTRVDRGARHDPATALYAGQNGLAAYTAIAKNARNWIKPGGKIYLEIGVDMGDDVRRIFADRGWTFVRAERDLGGVGRVLIFK